jgi:hypothetical protein
MITNPGKLFKLRLAYYILPPNEPNVGATYRAYLSQPLAVQATPQNCTLMRIYQPLATQNH